jgi:hypothetical protein
MTMIIAECERCGGIWKVTTPDDPEVLEGVCKDCNGDTDVERPLTFRRWGTDRDIEYSIDPDELPKDWIL